MILPVKAWVVALSRTTAIALDEEKLLQPLNQHKDPLAWFLLLLRVCVLFLVFKPKIISVP